MNQVSKDTWETFLPYGHKKIIQKNENLYFQGQDAKGFYYLDEGSVKISTVSERGTEMIVDIVTPGSLFSEQAFKAGTHMTTATITLPSIIYLFTDNDFKRVCQDHSTAIQIFMNSYIKKLRILAELYSMQKCKADQQVAHFLLKMNQIYHDKKIPINQTEMGQIIGISRITVNRIIQQWTDNGIVEYTNRMLQLKEPSKLAAISLGR